MNSYFDLIDKGENLKLVNEVLIDWFQVTIFPKKDYKNCEKLFYKSYCFDDKIIPVLFFNLFGINPNDIIKENNGFNGYDIRYSYRDINIMLNSTREDMGINILLRGCGCRDFEDLNIGWNNLFIKLVDFDINFNRIDIAIDNFDNKYFDLPLLKRYIDNDLCITKFRKYIHFLSGNCNGKKIHGDTLQFGSKASDIEITFYNKFLERESAGYIVDKNINFWVRTELRFRHDKAEEIFNLIYNNDDYMGLVKSVLYNYIDFKVSNSSDNNISRRNTVKWWKEFLNDCSKLKLSSRSSERRITKIHNWLLNMTSKSQLMVYFSNLNNVKLDSISIDLIYELLVKGSERITEKDLSIINDYRLSNNMSLLSRNDILDYIQDLKNTILD